jgi:hypothetical protein
MKIIEIGTWIAHPNDNRCFVFAPDTTDICRYNSDCSKQAVFSVKADTFIGRWCFEHFIFTGSWSTFNGKIPECLLEGLKKVLQEYPELALECF